MFRCHPHKVVVQIVLQESTKSPETPIGTFSTPKVMEPVGISNIYLPLLKESTHKVTKNPHRNIFHH
jgi:hypothetical protein